MNPTDTASLGTQAYNAANQTADLQGSVQPMLDQLKQNLVGIFAKDNPIIGARNDALSGYLSSNANTRASLLPSAVGDVPGVAGRPLTFSPTQQDSIVASRNAASLAPLAGYNEILKGMYGNIGDLVNSAGNIYGQTIQSNATRSNSLMDLYKQALAQDQFNQQIALQRQQAAYNMRPIIDPSLIASLLGGNSQGTQSNQGMPDLSKYEQQPTQQQVPVEPKVNLQGTLQAANVPGSTSLSSGGGNGGWALQPLLDSAKNWFSQFSAPQNNYAKSNQLGF